MDTEKSLLEEQKVKIKGGRLTRCKTPLVCLACLVLAGLFAALTVLMVNIEEDNQFIINSLLPSIKKFNEFQYWKNAHNHAEQFPGRVVWNQERSSKKSGNADEELGDDTGKYEASCTGGFIREGDLCYLYVDRVDTWDAAADHCRSLDAYLAEPRTHGQIDFLKSVSSKYNSPLWLGGTDQAVEGKWVWAHSGAAVDGPTDWSPNLPDDWRSGEDCLEIRPMLNLKWNDVPCELRRAFVCQKEITRKKNGKRFTKKRPYISGSTTTTSELEPSTPESPGKTFTTKKPCNSTSTTSSSELATSTTESPPKPCPTGYRLFGVKCYRYVGERKPWPKAAYDCQLLGGILAEPRSAQEHGYMKSLAEQSGKTAAVWTGGKLVAGTWTWDSDNATIPYLPWAPDEPKGFGECLSMWRERDYRFDDVYCTTSLLASVCETPVAPAITTPVTTPTATTSPATASCTRGFTPEGDLCYLYIDTEKTWAAAASHCRSLGAILAEPRTQTQVNSLKNVRANKRRDTWLGATDQAAEGRWVWAHDGVEVGGGNSTDWSDGQPDDFGSGEDCLEINDYLNWKWNDIPCDRRKPFVCQKERFTDDIE